jgi:tetratricopeptide (TPR) repeat protein
MRRSIFVVSIVAVTLLAGQGLAQDRDALISQCQERNEDIVIEGCTALIQSGLESERNLAVSFFHRGRAYFRRQDFSRALEDFDEAIRLDPSFNNAYFQRGDVYLALEEYDNALRDFGEVVRLNPDDAIAYRYRGNAYLAKGESENAIRDYDEALRLNPDDSDAREARARASAIQQ